MAKTASIQNDKLLQRMIREAKVPSLLRVGDGLYLQISRTRSTSWKFRYQINGKRRDMGLGSYPKLSLAEAANEAVDAGRLVAQGIDPIAKQEADDQAEAAAKAKSDAGVMTFRRAAESYIEAHRAGWRNAKHAWQWERTMEMFAYPKIGEKAVAEIATDDILSVLAQIWTTKPETASRVRSRIELVLGAAAALGHRSGANPARWRGHLDKLLSARIAKVVHQPAMAWRELPQFWPKVAGSPDVVARALAFTILTAARTSEVLLATWEEFDLSAGLWRVPAKRMKAGAEHVVPLPDAAIEILQAQKGADPKYPFPGRRMRGEQRPLCNVAMLARLRRLEPGLTVHGFRSSFRDWAADATDYPDYVVEKALAHAISNKVERAYRRGDLLEKRRSLMADWATFVATKPANNIVSITTAIKAAV